MIDQDKIRMARKVNLVSYLVNKGYKLKPEPGQGENFRLIGYQGLIVRKNHFFRFGGGGEKGNAIDFLVQVEGMTFQHAVEELLRCDPDPVRDKDFGKNKQRKEFENPVPSGNTSRILTYLIHRRGIPKQIVSEMIQNGLIYQDIKRNCVFPCMDSRGKVRGAFLRGTTKQRWVGVAEGSDVSYPWVLETTGGEDSVTVVESPIDAMSFLALYPQTRGYIIALGGLREKGIQQFLAENPEIKNIVLATDNDQPGRDFAQEQFEKLDKEYEVSVLHPPMGDWNEFLLSAPQISP